MDTPESGRRFVSRLRLSPEGLVLPTPEGEARRQMIASLDEDSCCSFEEWSRSGYRIIKGSKSYFQDIDGVPQFTKEQVEKSSGYPSVKRF